MKLKKETKIGIFIVVILSAIIVLINFLRGNDLFRSSIDLLSVYENVEGLNPSSPVYIKGFKAGSVVSIKYDKEAGNYIVKLNIKDEFEIPKDSKTEIYSADILGSRAIRITLGTSSAIAKTGDTLKGYVIQDMLSQIINGILPLSGQIEVLINNLNEAISNVNKILDEQTRSDISSILTGIKNSIDNIEYITAKIKGSTPEINELITNLNTLTQQLNLSADKLNGTLDTVDQELKEAQIKETITKLRTLIEKIQDPQGSIGKMITTDSLHNSINNLSIDIDSLVKKIERNPKKYLKISVF